jgi:hypothetical protein
MTSCPPLIGATPWFVQVGGSYHNCRRFNDRVIEALKALHRQGFTLTVMLAARWPIYSGREPMTNAESNLGRVFLQQDLAEHAHSAEAMKRGLDSTLRELSSIQATVGIVVAPPEVPYSAPLCVLRWRRDDGFCGVSREGYERYRAPSLAILRQSSTGQANVLIADPIDLFCGPTQCYAQRAAQLLYSDDNHPSASVARRAGRSDSFLFLAPERRGKKP